jgi:hypothetical protein
MSRTIQLKDHNSGMPVMATLGGYRNGEVYEIGPILLSIEDVLKLAEHAIVNGPSNDIRQRFVKNVSEYTTGEGIGGVKVFRPSVERSLAGTAAGL